MTTITIQIGMTTQQYNLYRTSAPQRYDYGYVLTLVESEGSRWILIPPQHAEYQIGRYSSGLYQTVPSDDLDEQDVTERIWRAINDAFSDPNAE